MRSFSEFCAYLGCPLTNARWSWSALSPDGRRAVFTLWSDEVKNRRYVLYPTSERRPREIPHEANQRLGALEIQRIAALAAQDPSIEALGILSFAKDPKAKTGAQGLR
jgi:5-methylcytosine-specific restriction protein A